MSLTMDQLADFLQAIGYHTVKAYPYLTVYPNLLVSALFPIYAGAHASLSRPSSAAKPPKKTNGDDEPEDQEQAMEGLGPAEALLLPLFAGLSLASLYFLIKWLEDPALLNKILNWYFAIFGVWSLTRMIRDSMGIFASLAFPEIYDMDGNVHEVSAKQRISKLTSSPSVEHNPPVSDLSILPSKAKEFMCTLRELSSRQLDVHVYIRQIMQAQFKLGPRDVTSLFFAVAVLLYFNLIDKPWWLTNLLGFGFAYSALQIMSPTTSWTGTLILFGLFLYDIYFVFFTPLMVTVATQLDIPAKLIFPRPSKSTEDPTRQAFSMLGLGDIVLPGMMIGFALRFDLYLFYLRRQSRRTIENSKGTTEDPANDPASVETEYSAVVKATWHPATGGWGERVWNSKDRILKSKLFQGVLFPKPYFRASVIGYVCGMLCTIGVMEIYGHAQPALLYLVPGVLGSLWGTALVNGDMKALWDFDEAEEEKEAEARRGKEKEDGAWKADSWLGIDWRSIFFKLPGASDKSKQPGNMSENAEAKSQATTNGHIKTPKHLRSDGDMADEFESSKSNHGEHTGPRSSDDGRAETKNSGASDGNRKEDEEKGAFDRDRKSELIFISINLSR